MTRIGSITNKLPQHLEQIKRIASDELGDRLKDAACASDYWWLTSRSIEYMKQHGVMA